MDTKRKKGARLRPGTYLQKEAYFGKRTGQRAGSSMTEVIRIDANEGGGQEESGETRKKAKMSL